MTYETLHELMFDRHRIRRWRIGTEDAARRLTRATTWPGYYQSRYVPERTIVSVVGAVPVEETLAVLRAAYGDWTAGAGRGRSLAGGAARARVCGRARCAAT